MPNNYFSFKSSDDEKRFLRIKVDQLKRALTSSKIHRTQIEKDYKKIKQDNIKKQEEIDRLKDQLEKVKQQRDMYKKMLFKPNIKHLPIKPDDDSHGFVTTQPKLKRGAKLGHIGHGRKLPAKGPDQIFRVFLTHCPNCHNPLKRTDNADSFDTHTVEDIPTPLTTPVVIKRYDHERQWCSNCKLEVKGIYPEEIPGVRLGVNLIIYLLILKYGCRMPLDSMLLLLNQTYGLTLSKGGIIQILRKVRIYWGDRYLKIKENIRSSPVKYSDETGWRINGLNNWIWGFMAKDQVYLQVEETRGKGVAEAMFNNCHEDDILVRDDYLGYKKLPLKQQSCWAHLLRKSHETAVDIKASVEVKLLHNKLKEMFLMLDKVVKSSFDRSDREVVYQQALDDLKEIIDTKYQYSDTKAIQTRVKNQGENLLTAIRYEGVPLTNNLAERSLRPMVVLRKVSGGSRSYQGAKTTAVNMSIYQTVKLQNLPLFETLRQYILESTPGKN